MQQLGHLEAAVMDRIWASAGPVLVRDVVEDLQHEREIAYTTVLTVMENLRRKGLLARKRDGRAFRYSPVRGHDAHSAAAMEEILADADDPTATLMHFVRHIDEGELNALRAAIDDRSQPPPPREADGSNVR